MIKYDRQDALLTATAAVPASASQTVYSAAIDAGFPGSIDECQLVIDAPAIGSNGTVTYTVQTCDTASGTFADTSASFAASNKDASAEFRTRMPLEARKYIRLKAVTASTAPSAAFSATLSIRV